VPSHRPLVSVCIPAVRGPNITMRALESALAQDLEDFEVVVSDDSGGALRDVVLAVGDPRIRYQANPEQLGYAGNHLAALRLARGRLIAFLHDDDRLLPGYLRAASMRFQDDDRLGVVLVGVLEDRRGVLTPAPAPPPGRYADYRPHLLDERFQTIPSASMFRREALEAAPQPWPDLTCADMAVYFAAAGAGWAFLVDPTPFVIFPRHEGQLSARETQFRDHTVRLWELLHFDDPGLETRRRARLASDLMWRARSRLKNGSHSAARADARRAARLGGPRVVAEATAVVALSAHPSLVRIAGGLWYALKGRPASAARTLDS
jgi:glycosyltransferase involved in cell wall biosynthesis